MNSDFNGHKKKKEIGFRYAWNGIKEVYKSERNFRLHLMIALIVIGAAFVMKLSPLEWTAIIIVIAVVLSLEMINSAIEKLLDHIAPEQHPIIGSIKDITAGAVLVASIGSIFIGIIIFLPKFLSVL
jgi:diacylglycerol kinase